MSVDSDQQNPLNSFPRRFRDKDSPTTSAPDAAPGCRIAPRSSPDKPHRRPGCCFRDRLGIVVVVLVRLHIGPHIFRRPPPGSCGPWCQAPAQGDACRSRLPSPQHKAPSCRRSPPHRHDEGDGAEPRRRSRRARRLQTFLPRSIPSTNIDIGPFLSRSKQSNRNGSLQREAGYPIITTTTIREPATIQSKRETL
ncbi:hypothetical protein ILFOPFJJ_06171 [Ensifer psoraleae]|nr:hypothetical protein [Sinorhizobium psoraleae]